MPKPRDTQRAKVRKSLASLQPFNRQLASDVDVESYIRGVLAHSSVRLMFPNERTLPKITVFFGRRPKNFRRSLPWSELIRNTMKLESRVEYSMITVLWKTAMCLAHRKYGDDIAWTGPEFCHVFLRVVNAGMGTDAARALAEAFDTSNVDHVVSAMARERELERIKAQFAKPVEEETVPLHYGTRNRKRILRSLS